MNGGSILTMNQRSAIQITVKQRVSEDGRMEVRARFPDGPTPLYFGPPFTFDSHELVLFFDCQVFLFCF